MTSVAIRPGVTADVETVGGLYEGWVAEANTYGLQAPNATELTPWLTDILLVCEINQRAIGFAHASVRTNKALAVFGSEAAYIKLEELYVMPEYRRQGIGSQLLQGLLSEARRRGIARSHVFSAAKDQHGILRFYEQHGFTAWGVQLFK
jgi:GNAT superfamily N-acetyltransferase